MAIASLIIGLIDLIVSFDMILDWLDLPSLLREPLRYILGDLSRFLHPLLFLIGIVGLVLGILAYMRKTRRRVALTGIVLNSLVSLSLIVVFVIVIIAM